MWKKEQWKKEDYIGLEQHLLSLKDEGYRAFHKKLVPTCNEDTIIGIRMPCLRQIAAEIAKGNVASFLRSPLHCYYEEIMVHALVLGYWKGEKEDVKKEISAFLPLIDNWAVCDCFVGNLKIIAKNQKDFYSFIIEYLHKKETYAVRFALVALMDYYTEKEYIDEILKCYDAVSHEDYYVKMAVAWGISVAYVKEREKSMTFLQKNSLDDFTYNKALQKIVESRRVSKEEKDIIRRMKRK